MAIRPVQLDDATGVCLAAPAGTYSTSVPQVPPAGFAVAANTQVLFFVDIDMTAANGDLVVSGILQGVH